jgi:hypothetical protein
VPVWTNMAVWPIGYTGPNFVVVRPFGYAEAYGSFMRGYLEPPQTGEYVFYIWSDDQGEFWLGENENPSSIRLVVNEPACCGYYLNRSRPILLEKGKRYYLEALQKEGVGGDYIMVGWRMPDGTLQRPISSLYIQPFPLDAVNQYQPKPSAPTFVGAGSPFVGPAYYHFTGSGQPMSTNVFEGQQVVLSAILEGTGAMTYQWSKNGTDIPGAVLSHLVIPSAKPADSGAYILRARNDLGEALSAPAVVVVRPDAEPPRPISAATHGRSQKVRVTFSEAVIEESMRTVSNYTLDNGLSVIAATVLSSNMVDLTTSGAMTEGVVYTLMVNGVKDRSSQANASAGAIPFVQTDGFVSVRGFTNIGGGWLVSDLTNSGKFISNAPDFQETPSEFEFPPYQDPGYRDHYGVQVRGYLTPSISGNYTFFVAGDDQSFLYLSADALPENKIKIASEPYWSIKRMWFPDHLYSVTGPPYGVIYLEYTGRNWSRLGNIPEGLIYDNNSVTFVNTDTSTAGKSRPVFLEAGKKYYIEALMKEGGGGDHIAVAWLGPNQPTLRNGDAPIGPSFLSPYGLAKTPIAIVEHPAAASTLEQRPVTFRVQATGYPFHEFQWQRNGQPIPGATNATYSFSPNRSDHGVKFSVAVSNGFSGAISQEAELSVTPDSAGPQLHEAAWIRESSVIGLCFDEPVESASALNPANYQLSNGSATIQRLEMRSDGKSVAVVLSGGFQPSGAALLVSGVRDLAGNTIAPGSSVIIQDTGFQSRDIGITASHPIWNGSVYTCNGKDFHLVGGGRDLSGNADGFYFVYREHTGDFDMAVQVESMPLTEWEAKGGLMVRTSLDPGSSMAYVVTTPQTGDNRFLTGVRSFTNGGTTPFGAKQGVNYPNAWVRLKRLGTMFHAYWSDSGQDWIRIGSTFLPEAGEVMYIGMAVSGRDRYSLAGDPHPVQFRNLRLYTDPLRLSVERVGSNIFLRWAPEHVGAQLEETDLLQEDPTQTIWFPVDGSTTTREWVVPLEEGFDPDFPPLPGSPGKFYRLIWP